MRRATVSGGTKSPVTNRTFETTASNASGPGYFANVSIDEINHGIATDGVVAVLNVKVTSDPVAACVPSFPLSLSLSERSLSSFRATSRLTRCTNPQEEHFGRHAHPRLTLAAPRRPVGVARPLRPLRPLPPRLGASPSLILVHPLCSYPDSPYPHPHAHLDALALPLPLFLHLPPHTGSMPASLCQYSHRRPSQRSIPCSPCLLHAARARAKIELHPPRSFPSRRSTLRAAPTAGPGPAARSSRSHDIHGARMRVRWSCMLTPATGWARARAKGASKRELVSLLARSGASAASQTEKMGGAADPGARHARAAERRSYAGAQERAEETSKVEGAAPS